MNEDVPDSRENLRPTEDGHEHVWLYRWSAKSTNRPDEIVDHYRCKLCKARTHCKTGQEPSQEVAK